MVGNALDGPGGMAAVAKAYRDAGFFDRWSVHYLCSYVATGWRTQMCVMAVVLSRCAWYLLTNQACAVHLHSSFRGSFWRKSLIAALGFLFRVPVVFHMHSGGFPTFYHEECSGLARAWIRYVLRRASLVICVSGSWLAEISRIEPSARLCVLGNPVAMPIHRPKNEQPGGPILLFLGRLRVSKGIFDLLDAFAMVIADYPESKLVLAGDGESDALWAHARKVGVHHNLILPGWVDGPEKEAWFSSATIFVLPSHFEALGIAILEAMLRDVPVVATNVGGIPDIVEHEHTGLLVPPHSPGQLAGAIKRLLDDPPLAQQLASQAHHLAESQYRLDVIVQQLDAIYTRLGISACVRGQ